MIAHSDYLAGPDDLFDRILVWAFCLLINENDDLGKRPSLSLVCLPSGYLLRYLVHQDDPAVHVRGDDRITDALKRHGKPFLFGDQGLFGLYPVGYVDDKGN